MALPCPHALTLAAIFPCSAHYELFIRALDAGNVKQPGAVCLVHPTVGPTQVRAAGIIISSLCLSLSWLASTAQGAWTSHRAGRGLSCMRQQR